MLLTHWKTPDLEAGLIVFVGLVGGTFVLWLLSLICGAAWGSIERRLNKRWCDRLVSAARKEARIHRNR